MTDGRHADRAAIAALLAWHVDSGVEDSLGAAPVDHLMETPVDRALAHPLYQAGMTQDARPDNAPEAGNTPGKTPQARAPKHVTAISPSDVLPADEAIRLAQSLAREADTIDALNAAVSAFNGCGLKRGARHTVFIDGATDGDLLVIGEGPGRDEDRIGKPFVGRAGQLLDRMLAAIDRSRTRNTLISNAVFWRPPGNRTPTREETAICRPFVMRLIALSAPKAVLLTGGAAMESVLGITGIMRNRGIWQEIEMDDGARVPALPVFHPAFLLRQPAQKRLAWLDLQSLNARLRDG